MTTESAEPAGRDVYYVTARGGRQPGLLLGPFSHHAIAARLVEASHHLARQRATFADFYIYDVGRYRLTNGMLAPAGTFNPDLLTTPAGVSLLAADTMPAAQQPRSWAIPGHGDLTTAPVSAGQLRLGNRVVLDIATGPAVGEVTGVYSTAAATPLVLRVAGPGGERNHTVVDPRVLLHRVAEQPRPGRRPRPGGTAPRRRHSPAAGDVAAPDDAAAPTAAQIAGQLHAAPATAAGAAAVNAPAAARPAHPVTTAAPAVRRRT